MWLRALWGRNAHASVSGGAGALNAPSRATAECFYAGVLGPTLVTAERMETNGAVNGLTCSGEAQRIYLSSSFQFVERAHSLDAAGSGAAAQPQGRPVMATPLDSAGGVFDVCAPPLSK